MAYDMIKEAMLKVRAGEITTEEMMDAVNETASMHIVSRYASGKDEFDIEMGHRGGAGNLTLHVVVTVTEGKELLESVVHEANSMDDTAMDDIVDSIIGGEHGNKPEDKLRNWQ